MAESQSKSKEKTELNDSGKKNLKMLLQVRKIIHPRRTGEKAPFITVLREQDQDNCNIWCGFTVISIPNKLCCAVTWERSYSVVGGRF